MNETPPPVSSDPLREALRQLECASQFAANRQLAVERSWVRGFDTAIDYARATLTTIPSATEPLCRCDLICRRIAHGLPMANRPSATEPALTLAAKIKELAYEMSRQDVSNVLAPPSLRDAKEAKATAVEFESAVDALAALSSRATEPDRNAALEEFHAFFRDRCEMLFSTFGMEAIDIYNRAGLATRTATKD